MDITKKVSNSSLFLFMIILRSFLLSVFLSMLCIPITLDHETKIPLEISLGETFCKVYSVYYVNYVLRLFMFAQLIYMTDI